MRLVSKSCMAGRTCGTRRVFRRRISASYTGAKRRVGKVEPQCEWPPSFPNCSGTDRAGFLILGATSPWESDWRHPVPKSLNSEGKLTRKQALFVREYLVDLNATAAARRAGYSADTAYAIGAENLRKPQIAEAVARLVDERTRKLDITGERVLQGLAEIAFSNILDFIEATPDGQVRVDLSSIDRTHAGGVAQITIDTLLVEGHEVVRTRIRLGNKIAALKFLARYIGLGGHTGEVASPQVQLIITGAPAARVAEFAAGK